MKRKFLFTLCIYCVALLISSQLHAQKTEYQSVFGETNTSFNLYNFQWFRIYTDSACFVKDTLVNGIGYKKFDVTRKSIIMPHENNRDLGMVLLRESEDLSKLYCLYPDNNSEVLLMDLNLNVQDTFSQSFVVDSIFYDDENTKHIILSMHFPDDDVYDCFYWCCQNIEFIEGVGPTLFIYGTCLLCAHKDLNHYVTNHWVQGCFYEWIDSHIDINNILAIKNNLKIYPNPAHHFVEIDFGEDFMNYQSLFVYDLLGRPCLNTSITQEKQRIDIQSLPSGIYIIKAIGKDKPPVYGKFSVTR